MREVLRSAAGYTGRVVSGSANRVVGKLLERRYGGNTGEYLYLEEIGVEDGDTRLWHEASDWLGVRRALARLHPTPDDVFVDYGSGLGRAVLVAAGFPFKRVIGVEIAARMTARAQENVDRNRERIRAREVELVTSDAVAWDVPHDLTVAYFYSPFAEDVFDAVVAKLFASVDEHPRPLRIVYNYPLEHTRLLRTGRVRLLEAVNAIWPRRSVRRAEVILTYLALPSDEELTREYLARFPQRLNGAQHWLGEYEPGYVFEKPDRLGGVWLERPSR